MRLCVVAALVAAAVVGITAPRVHAADRTAPIADWIVKRLDLPVWHTAYVPSRDVLLAGVRADHAALGNELVEIDPESGALGRHVFVGSEPSRVAVSDDGLIAYVGLQGASRIVTVNLVTFTVVRVTAFDHLDRHNRYVRDLAVAPGRNDLVVFSLYEKHVGPDDRGVWAMQDGVVLPEHTATSGRGVTRIEFVDGVLYGIGYDPGLVRLSLDSTGVSVAESIPTPDPGLGDSEAAGDLLVSATGVALDPKEPSKIVEYAVGGWYVEPTPDDDRVTFHQQGTIRQYQLGSGEAIGERFFYELLEGGDIESSATGFAVVTRYGLVLLGPNVEAGEVAMPPAQPTSVDDLREALLPFPANDLEFDPLRNVLYASVPPTSHLYPDEVVAINAFTGIVLRRLPLGDNPGDLALSDDLTTLYVGLNDAPEIVRVDPTLFVPLQRSEVGTLVDKFGQETVVFAEDIAVQPGDPGTIAVSLRNIGYSLRNEGVALYRNGVRQPDVIFDPDIKLQRIEFGGPTVVFGTNPESTTFEFYQLEVTATGISPRAMRSGLLPYGGVDFEMVNGRAWTSRGYVVDPHLMRTEAELPWVGAIEVMPLLGRAYQLHHFMLREYDATTYRQLGSRTVDATALGNVLVGTTIGLAAIVEEGILLLNPDLCSGRVATARTVGAAAVGTAGDDVIIGSSGADTINGGGGNDTICAGDGSDVLLGGDGNDRLLAGLGNDRLRGDGGRDDLWGGPGLDAVYLGATAAPHRVDLDNTADDGAAGEGDNVRSNNEMVVGSPGDDTIIGTDGSQMLRGMGGNDRLAGLGGNDSLAGGDGQDRLYGGDGDDQLSGGDGADYCVARSGLDTAVSCATLVT